MDDLTTYKAQMMETIIEANQQLMLITPNNNVVMWNIVNDITSRLWHTYHDYLHFRGGILDLNKVPKVEYVLGDKEIKDNHVLCIITFGVKRLTIQSTINDSYYFGIEQTPTRDSISGLMRIGGTPHILHWLFQ